MVANCSAEHSFSQLKHIRNLNGTAMRQEKLDSLSLLMIVADLLCKIKFDDIIIIMDFARHKYIKNLKCKCMFSLINER